MPSLSPEDEEIEQSFRDLDIKIAILNKEIMDLNRNAKRNTIRTDQPKT